MYFQSTNRLFPHQRPNPNQPKNQPELIRAKAQSPTPKNPDTAKKDNLAKRDQKSPNIGEDPLKIAKKLPMDGNEKDLLNIDKPKIVLKTEHLKESVTPPISPCKKRQKIVVLGDENFIERGASEQEICIVNNKFET